MRARQKNPTEITRREFVTAAVAAPVAAASLLSSTSVHAAGEVVVTGPDGKIKFTLVPGRKLSYNVTFRGKPVVDTSDIGIIIDGKNLGEGAEIGKTERYRGNERYPWRGVHSVAVSNCRGTRVNAVHAESKTPFTIDVRVFDDGVAFRYVVPGSGSRVPDEATSFTVPEGSITWFHDFNGHYEGTHTRKLISEVKDGEWAAPPLTYKLPNGAGYASLTEAALMNYAGMGYQANGRHGFRGVLGHGLQVSHPYELRYTKEDIARLAIPAPITGTITTPWRVVMIAADLNGLVNSDIIHNVSPPPDKSLFPAGFATPWIRPGRAVWRYLDGGDNTFEGMKEFSRLAGELGFEHNIVEGIWHRWTEDQMRELTTYSKQWNVGIWFWEHCKNLKTAEQRKAFFEQLNRVSVVGSKIDFFDHEAKEVIDQYQALLRDAAEHKIMLEFHGANKPAGESRTWPNEMTREAIRGMEYRSMETRAVHNTTLPFTRFLAGHGDYTPVHFGERRRETSWPHQIATAIVFLSPVMIYGAHPKSIMENPAVDLIKSIPAVWDETVVLDGSEIGEMAAFARRKGRTWFVGILNGPNARKIKLPLSFLFAGEYSGSTVRDKIDDAGAEIVDKGIAGRGDLVEIEMRAGGGYVARYTPVGVKA